MPLLDWMKSEGLSAKAAKQVRLGIATGESIYNLYVKGECEGVKRAMVEASKTSKLTYETAIRILTERLREARLIIHC